MSVRIQIWNFCIKFFKMIKGHGDDIFAYKNIRLNFSSNIYPKADITPLLNYLSENLDVIKNYPEPSAQTLEDAIAKYHSVPAKNVLATAGATEAIYLIAQTFRKMGSFSVCNPAFREYEDACKVFGMNESPRSRIYWICNPCNPTGEVFCTEEVDGLLNEHELVVEDLSYKDYTLEKMMSVAEGLDRKGLIQLYSLTKRYAIPGLRIGYVIASEEIISRLRENTHPWSVNSLAIVAGKFLLKSDFKAIPNLPSYLAVAQRLRDALNYLDGVEVLESKTNFMLCKLSGGGKYGELTVNWTAEDLKEFLAREKGILIRSAANFKTLTPYHFRVASSIEEENAELVAGIKEFLERI